MDGCFWHGCPEHHTVAKTNADYWADKVRANRIRDVETVELLDKAGWRVVRIWEHESVLQAANVVERLVRVGTPTAPRSSMCLPGSATDGKR